jgi:hypothetical protein
MQVVRSLKTWWPQPPFWSGGAMGFLLPLLLVAITTVTIGVATRFVDLGHVGAIYLIAVLISAMRWGLAPALLAATTSVAASAFFFYPPIYSFHVQDWEQLIDLVLFTIVAVVTSQLAVGLRRQIDIADRFTPTPQTPGAVRVSPYATYGTDALAESVVAALRDRSAAIMGNHGAVTMADGLPRAYALAEYLEYLCDVHLRALATGLPVRTLPPEEIAAVAARA